MALMSELGYQAVGLGQTDHLAGGEQFYDTAQKYKIAVLDANPYANPKSVPFVIRNVCGVKVGILSFGYVPQDVDSSDYSFRKTIYSAFKQARDASDILILLDQANRVNAEWLTRNAPRLGAPDIVIGGAMRSGMPAEEVVGKTYIVPSTIAAKQVGVVDITLGPNGERKVVTKRVQLDESVKPDEAVNKRIAAFLYPGQPVAVQQPTPPAPNPTAPITPTEQQNVRTSQRTYFAPSQCKACHVKEYENWAASRHAKAIKTLVDAKRVAAECLPCHSEEYLRVQKVTLAQDNIGGVDCAACHFESLPHGLERKVVTNRPTVSALKCLSCHTKERSPNYDEQAYFPQISHKKAQTAAKAAATAP